MNKKISCNCKKTKCLKLYCECYNAGKICGGDCKCLNCSNTEEHSKLHKHKKFDKIEKNKSK